MSIFSSSLHGNNSQRNIFRYYQAILKDVDPRVKEVELVEDGSWRVCTKEKQFVPASVAVFDDGNISATLDDDLQIVYSKEQQPEIMWDVPNDEDDERDSINDFYDTYAEQNRLIKAKDSEIELLQQQCKLDAALHRELNAKLEEKERELKRTNDLLKESREDGRNYRSEVQWLKYKTSKIEALKKDFEMVHDELKAAKQTIAMNKKELRQTRRDFVKVNEVNRELVQRINFFLFGEYLENQKNMEIIRRLGLITSKITRQQVCPETAIVGGTEAAKLDNPTVRILIKK